MIEGLKDPAWGGVAALAAVAALVLTLFGRPSDKPSHLLSTFFGCLGFATLGSFFALPIMVVSGLVGDALYFSGLEQLTGRFGQLATRLSNVTIGPWGFGSHLPEISRQMSALGLWFGGLLSAVMLAFHGQQINFDTRRLPSIVLFVPFAGLLFIMFVGIVNSLPS